jgi:hypothetical protein
MKVIVECRQEKPNEYNYSEVEHRNYRIYNLAGDFELSMLFAFGSTEPVDEEVVLLLFYDAQKNIKWAFKEPDRVPEAIKELIRKNLSGD